MGRTSTTENDIPVLENEDGELAEVQLHIDTSHEGPVLGDGNDEKLNYFFDGDTLVKDRSSSTEENDSIE